MLFQMVEKKIRCQVYRKSYISEAKNLVCLFFVPLNYPVYLY